MTLWIYQPLHNTIFVANSQEEANEIMWKEGGWFHSFDHLPTLEEKYQAWLEYRNQETSTKKGS